MDEKRELLRHTLATVAYRAARPSRARPISLPDLTAPAAAGADSGPHGRSLRLGAELGHGQAALARHTAPRLGRGAAAILSVAANARCISVSDQPLQAPAERLFQGPIADALTHVGQLAMLRRLSGSPTRGENFYRRRDQSRSGGRGSARCGSAFQGALATFIPPTAIRNRFAENYLLLAHNRSVRGKNGEQVRRAKTWEPRDEGRALPIRTDK